MLSKAKVLILNGSIVRQCKHYSGSTDSWYLLCYPQPAVGSNLETADPSSQHICLAS